MEAAGRCIRVLLASLCLSTASLAAAVRPADATASRTARATLHQEGESQRGRLWLRQQAGAAGASDCVISTLVGRRTFGPALHVGGGTPVVRIRFHKSLRPYRKPIVKVWTTVDAEGHPLGVPRRIPSQLVKEMHRGHQRWASLIEPDVFSDLYISVLAGWNDPKACGIEDAGYTFHIAP